jgi:MoaA/NifB/PqqE/SkfB family radical SAM enzyme
LDRIKISVYGLSRDHYKTNTGVAVDFDRYVDNIADLYRCKKGMQIYVKIMEEGLSDDQKEFFLRTFGEICDTIYFEHCVENWPEFESGKVIPIANSAVGILGQKARPYKNVCPQPFYNLTVCADGKVTACCADWGVKLVVGNAAEVSLIEIWNSDSFRKFRLMMLRGERRTHPVCAGCGYPTYTCVDDIDDAAQVLLERCDSLEAAFQPLA